jgi:hypothetical protein
MIVETGWVKFEHGVGDPLTAQLSGEDAALTSKDWTSFVNSCLAIHIRLRALVRTTYPDDADPKRAPFLVVLDSFLFLHAVHKGRVTHNTRVLFLLTLADVSRAEMAQLGDVDGHR